MILLKLTLFIIIAQTATILHECGHALFSLIFTKDDVNISLGVNKTYKKMKLGRLSINIKRFSPMVGYVQIEDDKISDLKKILIFLGGPIVSLIMFILLGYINIYNGNFAFDFSINYFLIQFIITIIPIKYSKIFGSYSGYYSDGYNVLKIILSKRKYNLKVHCMICLFASILIRLTIHINNLGKDYSIGVIGGADGPTVIYGSDNISYLLMKCIIFINNLSFVFIFIILILMYKPIKYIIEKIKVV